MAEPSIFRHYQIVQDASGSNVELARTPEQVAVLAFDRERMDFVNCHVLLQPLDNRTAFEQSCKNLQRVGHPLFARLVDFGEDDGNPFYITGNVDGETLRTYFQRQQEIPVWLAVMIAGRALESAIALTERGDYLSENALDTFRICQTGSSAIQVIAADYRVVERAGKNKVRLVKANFDRQAKFLRAFLQEKAGGGSGPTLPETQVIALDFSELLGAVLGSGGPELIDSMREIRDALRKIVPDHLAAEIPTLHKPRALVAPLLASYQDVARAVVNLVRIQSQRLDMANPYAMRGTLTRAGRPVMVEQVPPANLAGRSVLDFDLAAQKLARKRDVSALISVPLVNEVKGGITCIAEELVEGISLTELLAERDKLEVNEVYLILAGLDAALTQLETSRLPTRKLRLEDILLLTGMARDDSRTARLLKAKLTEWPSFNIMLRAHPTLAAMTGRGTDPGVLLPPPLPGGGNIWHGGWLSCVAHFLLAGAKGATPQRELEGIRTLLEEELNKARDGSPTSRADFLARYARIIQHFDLVQSVPITVIPPSSGKKAPATKSLAPVSSPAITISPAAQTVVEVRDPLTTTPIAKVTELPPRRDEVPASRPLDTTSPSEAKSRPLNAPPSVEMLPASPIAVALGAAPVLNAAVPLDTADSDGADESIGFAELLFQGSRNGDDHPGSPVHQQMVWGSGASAQMESGEVGGWDMDVEEPIPSWLKASVFFGGTLVAGAILAHLSGEALWQKESKTLPIKQAAPLVAPVQPSPPPSSSTIVTPVAPRK
ncbi:MAG: hypothetical protein JNJ83_00160 [Verrucomicrobiaceae bacterium]|nr:hypothetical protein [Verrucomicrobiaceae bacterium]